MNESHLDALRDLFSNATCITNKCRCIICCMCWMDVLCLVSSHSMSSLALYFLLFVYLMKNLWSKICDHFPWNNFHFLIDVLQVKRVPTLKKCESCFAWMYFNNWLLMSQALIFQMPLGLSEAMFNHSVWMCIHFS